MPNMSSHMAVAKKVGEILNIKDKDFIFGNILPDLYNNKEKSHYKIMGKFYLIPDIDYYINNFDLKNNTNLGYLSHLLLDKYYLEEYLTKKLPNIDVFDDDAIYYDYDILNNDIISKFDLDIKYLEKILREYSGNFNNKKMNYNISYLFIKKDGKTKFLDKEEFIKFLEDISYIIAEDIKKYRS